MQKHIVAAATAGRAARLLEALRCVCVSLRTGRKMIHPAALTGSELILRLRSVDVAALSITYGTFPLMDLDAALRDGVHSLLKRRHKG